MTRKIRMLLLMALDVLLVNAATVSAVLLVSKVSLLSGQAGIGALPQLQRQGPCLHFIFRSL